MSEVVKVTQQLTNVRARINKAAGNAERSPDSIKLIAVSKHQADARVDFPVIQVAKLVLATQTATPFTTNCNSSNRPINLES